MWHMQSGNRVLDAQEATLFVEIAAVLVDELQEESVGLQECHLTGFAAFDSLDWQTRLRLLYDVLRALLYENVSAPELTAFNESAIAAVFDLIEVHVRLEIESAERGDDECLPIHGLDAYSLRRLILACQPRNRNDQGWSLPTIDSTDLAAWSLELEVLRRRILWDEAFAMYNRKRPMSATTLSKLNIEDRYFTSVPPTPAPSDIPSLWRSTKAITHRNLAMPSAD